MKRKIAQGASDLLIGLLGLNRPLRIYRAFIDRIDAVKRVEFNGTGIRFAAKTRANLQGPYQDTFNAVFRRA